METYHSRPQRKQTAPSVVVTYGALKRPNHCSAVPHCNDGSIPHHRSLTEHLLYLLTPPLSSLQGFTAFLVFIQPLLPVLSLLHFTSLLSICFSLFPLIFTNFSFFFLVFLCRYLVQVSLSAPPALSVTCFCEPPHFSVALSY